jgi:hypothetical protein
MSAYTDLQSKFAFNMARFLRWLEVQGYQVGLGEAWRSDMQAAWNEEHGIGTRNSLHCDRMAQDLIIRKNGVQVGKEDYERCGAAWEALDTLNKWGGRFTGKTAGDWSHFSQTYQGRS